MSGSINKVVLIGNLGTDPEARSMQNGGQVVSFSLATSDQWKDKNTGEKREKTEWHKISVFDEHIGGVAMKYLKKGSQIYLVGTLRTNKFIDKNGVEQYSTEVVIQKFNGELTMLGSSNFSPKPPTEDKDVDIEDTVDLDF